MENKVTVDSHAATSLAKAMGQFFLASIGQEPGNILTGNTIDTQCIASSIVGLVNDIIQAIIGDALPAATTMFPHKPPAKPGRGTIPRHLWPKSSKHDVLNIRRRASHTRRFINNETKAQRGTPPAELSTDPSLPL